MRMPPEAPIIALGSILLFIGLSSLVMALLRRRVDVRALFWFGIFSGTYGFRLLLEAMQRQPGLSAASAQWFDNSRILISYFILILALLFWRQLTLGAIRRFIEIMMIPTAINAVIGTIFLAVEKRTGVFDAISSVLAICIVSVLIVVSFSTRLSRSYLAVPAKVVAFGSILFALVVLYVNLGNFLGFPYYDYLEPTAFTMFVISLGYVAAERVFDNERRLLSIEKELAIARDIQNSILPEKVPDLDRIRVAAAYRPMTAVAGDFYDFVITDRNRAGFLVADVSGHGVPAALIASMIKVAVHSVADCAHDPAEVLRRLNQSLSPQLRGQFVTAAYLWIDTDTRTARYSAAGHPPLLYWRGATRKLESVQSNGLLFGVLPDGEYPVCELKLVEGDRLLLYTDGLTEAEDVSGDAFGDARLERVFAEHHQLPAASLCDKLLAELRNWQPASVTQQDDITLVAIDVL